MILIGLTRRSAASVMNVIKASPSMSKVLCAMPVSVLLYEMISALRGDKSRATREAKKRVFVSRLSGKRSRRGSNLQPSAPEADALSN